MSASNFDLTPVGTIVDLEMPAGKNGTYVYLDSDGKLTCEPVSNQNPLYIRISDAQGILLDGGAVSEESAPEYNGEGWAYSSYLTTSDPKVKRTLLQLHIREVSDAMSNPYAIDFGGSSWSKSQLETYLATLKGELISLEAALGKRKRIRIGRSYF